MKLSSVTQSLLADLVEVVHAVDPAAGDQVARILPAGAPALSMRLLALVTELSAELSRTLPAGRVEVRLVSADAAELVYVEAEPAAAPTSDDGETARLTVRLPQGLKERAERTAEAAGLSLNAWIVTQLSDALGRHGRRGGQHLTGFGKA